MKFAPKEKKKKSNESVYFYRGFTDVELLSRNAEALAVIFQVLIVFTRHKYSVSGFT